jgi:hypothetical protein
MIEINLVDFISIIALEDTFFSTSLNLDNNLTRRNIIEQELSFLFFFDTCVINVDRTAKVSCNKSTSIVFPADSSDCIIVFNIFANNFFPLPSFLVEIVDIKSVEISDSNTLSRGVEIANSKVFDFLIMSIVESLQNVSKSIIKSDFLVISCSNYVLTVSKTIRN